MKSLTVWHGHSTRPSLPAGTARKDNGSLPRGRQNRLILQPKKNRKFPLGNSLLYISLSYVVLIASFTNSAILNDRFAICNSRLLSTNQIVNCDGRVRPGGRTLFLFYTLIEKNFVSYCKSLYIFSYCSIQTFAASIPQSSRFMDRALIHPKKFMKVI